MTTLRHVRPVVGFRVHATYSEGLEGETLCGRRPKGAPGHDTSTWLPADDETVDCPRCLELYPAPAAASEPDVPELLAAEPPAKVRGLRNVARIARKYLRFLGP
jgi:hypothetical protein